MEGIPGTYSTCMNSHTAAGRQAWGEQHQHAAGPPRRTVDAARRRRTGNESRLRWAFGRAISAEACRSKSSGAPHAPPISGVATRLGDPGAPPAKAATRRAPRHPTASSASACRSAEGDGEGHACSPPRINEEPPRFMYVLGGRGPDPPARPSPPLRPRHLHPGRSFLLPAAPCFLPPWPPTLREAAQSWP